MWKNAIFAYGRLVNWLDRKFPSYTRSRIFDMGQLEYLALGIWISNKKIRNLGFEFTYADVREGLADTIQWLILNGKIQ